MAITSQPAQAQSPDSLITFDCDRDGNWEIYLLDVTTGAEYRLTNNRIDDMNPYWSPDGTKLVFEEGSRRLVGGTVLRMYYHSAGGVIESGKPIKELV